MRSESQKSFPDAIMAAGGIVVTAGRPPRVAIVQRRKDDGWVLPKGKLKARETALAAAQREAREETGRRVVVHDYLGVLSYESGARPKIVQFWRMVATGEPQRAPVGDIKAVKWLPLQEAIARLSQPIERAFLAQVGQRSLRPAVSRLRQSPSVRSKLAKPKRPVEKLARSLPAEPDRHDLREAAKSRASPNFIRRFLRRLQEQNAPLS